MGNAGRHVSLQPDAIGHESHRYGTTISIVGGRKCGKSTKEGKRKARWVPTSNEELLLSPPEATTLQTHHQISGTVDLLHGSSTQIRIRRRKVKNNGLLVGLVALKYQPMMLNHNMMFVSVIAIETRHEEIPVRLARSGIN